MSKVPTLSYAPPGRRRLRIIKWTLVVIVAIAAGVAVKMVRAYLVQREPFPTLIERCSRLSAPPGTVVYAEKDQANTVVSVPGYTRWQGADGHGGLRAAYLSANDYAQLGQAGGAGLGGFEAGGPALFVHQLTSAQGRPAMVAVALDDMRARVMLVVTVAQPMGLFDGVRPKAYTTSVDLGEWPPDLLPVRIFAGQPDPNDAGRFTIDYAFDDHPGVIDGVLNKDLSVSLTARTGPLAKSSSR